MPNEVTRPRTGSKRIKETSICNLLHFDLHILETIRDCQKSFPAFFGLSLYSISIKFGGSIEEGQPGSSTQNLHDMHLEI